MDFNAPNAFERLQWILGRANNAVQTALMTLEDRTGGYFCLAEQNGRILTLTLLGTIPDLEKAKKYRHFAEEKALRLAEHSRHVSSWQSRDPKHDKWGGAIRTSNLIFSFSGFPELWDEALMLVTAVHVYPQLGVHPKLSCIFPEEDRAEKTAAVSENPFYKQLLRNRTFF